MSATTGTTTSTFEGTRTGTGAGASVLVMPYRTADAHWLHERDALLAEREEQSRHLARVFSKIYATRWARVGAGVVMVLGAVALFVSGLAHLFVMSVMNQKWTPPYSIVLLVTLGLAAVIYLLTRILTGRDLGRTVRQSLVTTHDARTDVERLAGRTATSDAADLVGRLERPSLTWPLIGFSLVTPLSIHLALALLMSVPLAGFDTWIAISLVLTVPAHITLAVFAGQLGGDLSAHGPYDAPNVLVGRAAMRAWGVTVLVSLVPGVLLLAIPPVIVAMTGVFIPILFTTMGSVASGERAKLALARGVEPL